MGVVTLVLLLCFTLLFGASSAAEDVEFKDPHLLDVATYAASNLIDDDELELENFTLSKVLDAQLVPQASPLPTIYLLTLEMGPECAEEEDGDCDADVGTQICEVTVADDLASKSQSLVEDRTDCKARESNQPLSFSSSDSSIAQGMQIGAPETLALVDRAIAQMAAERGGKHALKQIGQARKVTMQDTNSNLYYLTLYISTVADDAISEVCEVTMEEALGSKKKEPTLQSLRCFTTGEPAEGGGEALVTKLGLADIPAEELTPALVRGAVLASLAVIDAESLSQFQLKVVGYSVARAQSSLDSGTRDITLKLGLVPTLCIKRAETSDGDDDDDDETAMRSCSVDSQRDPSVCTITLTQWPWVTDGYLFSDLKCDQTNLTVVSEQLEAYSDDDATVAAVASATNSSEAEVGEVEGNGVQATSREGEGGGESDEEEEDDDDDDDDQEAETEETEEKEEAVEEPVVAQRAPCAGCPVELDPQDVSVQQLAALALTAVEQAVNSDRALAIQRVVKATQQVVAGTLYELTVETVETDCVRAANTIRADCKIAPSDIAGRRCTVSIIDQPWIGPKHVIRTDCATDADADTEADAEADGKVQKDAAPASQTRSVGAKKNVGAPVSVAPDDGEVQQVAQFALNSLDSFDADVSKKRVLVRVIDAAYQGQGQVENGEKLFTLKVQQALADCPEARSAAQDAQARCRVNGQSANYLCDFKVLHQPRLALSYRLIDSKCWPVKGQAVMRDVDPADARVQDVARSVGAAVNKRSVGDKTARLIRVVKAAAEDALEAQGTNVFVDVEVGNH